MSKKNNKLNYQLIVKLHNLKNLKYINNLFNDNYLKISSRCCLILGKNASGKSSIAKCIYNEFNNDKTKVKIFKKNLAYKDKKLDTFSLGSKNLNINKQISNINKSIGLESFRIEKTKDKYSKYNNSYKTYLKKINNWYTNCARDLREDHRHLVNLKYTKKYFKKDVNRAIKLTVNEKKHTEQVLYDSIRRLAPKPCTLPKINIKSIFTKTELILDKVILPGAIDNSLKGLNNENKIPFIIEGVKLHNANELCSFCGNKITKSRWLALKKIYDKYSWTVDKIHKEINYISICQRELYPVKLLDLTKFYIYFHKDVYKLNNKITQSYHQYNSLLMILQNSLEEKIKHINNKIDIDHYWPSNLLTFPTLQNLIYRIIKQNKNYLNIINKVKDTCKHRLLLNRIYKMKKKV